MKKKFYGALLLGSLFLAGGMVSCSDYDDDINSLNERVDALEKTVADLKKAIEAGAVITNVQSTENGVTVTLSDGKTFEVKNGTNGAPGSVVTIDEEGYWCIDGKRQTDKDGKPYKAQGEKGDTGADGKDGCWYFPDEDGFWHKQYYNEEGKIVDEPTDVAWTPSAEESVRIVYDPVNGYLKISNAEGMKEGEVFVIDITSALKSLAVIPYVIDRKSGLPVASFYNIMGYTPSDEFPVEYGVATSADAQIHYRLNPSNANVNEWNWSMIDRIAVINNTRADGDQNELLTIKKYSYSHDGSNGELTVTLRSNKSLADLSGTQTPTGYAKEIAIAALQATNKKQTNAIITSDYVKVSCRNLSKFSIINPSELPINYDNAYAKVDEDFKDEMDLHMAYTGSLNLNEWVATLSDELTAEREYIEGIAPSFVLLEDLLNEGEVTYKFTLPEKYMSEGDNTTNQQDFVTLSEDGVLSVDKTKYPNGTAAIGRTPIVSVYAMVNGKVVASAWIRVAITREEMTPLVVKAEPVAIDYADINPNGEQTPVGAFTWAEMNQKVYDVLGLDRVTFNRMYETVPVITYTDAKGNKVNGINIKVANITEELPTTTNFLTMYMNPAVVPSNVTGVVTVTYNPIDENKETHRPIVIEFDYTVSHTHQLDLEFNPQHVEVIDGVGIAKIKGVMNGSTWKHFAEIKEHFINLDEYVEEKMLGNHNSPRLIINTKAPRVTDGVKLIGNDLYDQTIELTIPVIGKEFIVPVTIVEPLANGEVICGETYEIHFINPFSITTTITDLEAVFPGRADAQPITITIKEIESGKEIATIKGEKGANDGKFMDFTITAQGKAYGLDVETASDDPLKEKETEVNEGNASDEYDLIGGIKSKDIRVLITEADSQSWGKLYGMNNDGTQRLTLDKNTGMIKWENRGTSLVHELTPSYNVEVRLGNISILSATKQFKVKETNLPTEE